MTYRIGLLPVVIPILAMPAWAQERARFPGPPDGMRTVGIGVMVDGKQEVRQLSYSLRSHPEPSDEDDTPAAAPRPMRLNIQDMVLEQENFDRWLFADVRSEEEHRVLPAGVQ